MVAVKNKTAKVGKLAIVPENVAVSGKRVKVKAPAKPILPPKSDIPAPPALIDIPAPPPLNTAEQSPQSDEKASDRPDFDRLSKNLGRLAEEGIKVAAAYMEGARHARVDSTLADTVNDATRTLGHVAEYWLSDPTRALKAQTGLSKSFVDLWAQTMHRLAGENVDPLVPVDPSDKRFSDPQWRENPVFDFLRQAYSLTTSWANHMIEGAETVEPQTRQKAQFYMRQIAGAVSPSNFLPTNPELLRETLKENGENLVRGMHMLANDVAAGDGQLRIRQADGSKFELGVNMAATPGKVIFRNELMELIQYTPTTEEVYKRPLLIVPPWINKFYILDLNPQKSFIRWAVSQGFTVFVISWVNPDARLAGKGFDDYVKDGISSALDAITNATGERDVAAIGYCVGGTLLAVSLAYMAAIGDARISSVTFFATQVDFSEPGELKYFVDETHVRAVEEAMAETGYLKGQTMASAFNMLRPNELIWSYVVNNYMKGQEPPAFDLLVWNADSTRLPMANHSFYLRNCYLENNLTKGKMSLLGKVLDLHAVKIPVYNLATREDHIAPARSVFKGAGFFGGPMRYVLSGSGHIAGVVNPADSGKYQFWTGGPVGESFDAWLAGAKETPGSWWRDWLGWITAQAPAKVAARVPGEGSLKAICDAPGEYVRVKA